MKGKIVLEEHVSTALNNRFWDASGEAARNGKAYMADVDKRLLDTEQRIADMDRCGIETAVISLTSPGAQSLLDVHH
jgi:phosphoribosylaminoimidazole-succinocarboxamide synthase